jgi:hypothetical protein
MMRTRAGMRTPVIIGGVLVAALLSAVFLLTALRVSSHSPGPTY